MGVGTIAQNQSLYVNLNTVEGEMRNKLFYCWMLAISCGAKNEIGAPHYIQNTYKVGSPINIRFTITNISDQTISFDLHSRDKKYFRKGITFLDARDGNGNLAPETEAGCVSHFFSSCHTEYYPKFGNPRRWRIMEPNATVVDDYSRLDIDYKISPGEYTVVGYLCGMNEGPECIKSNAIKITVQ